VLAHPAQAQVLLSNTANPTDGDYGGGPDSSDHITTGNVPLSVSRIDIVWETLGATPGPNRVGIFTEAGGFASTTQVGSWFTNPSATTTGVMSYVGGAELAANTTYWVVIDINDSSQVAYTRTDTFVSDPSTQGAVILDRSAWGNWETATWNGDSANLKFALVGAARAAVPTLGLAGTIMMITVLLLVGVGILRMRT
jgi:hypothetical protein